MSTALTLAVGTFEQPHASLLVEEQSLPSVVFEVGWTQTLPNLHNDVNE